jgi:hypothetical protein
MHSREYEDGQYYYGVIPMKDLGNVVILENLMTKETVKKYFTEDDDAAIAVFESMIDCQFNEGSEFLKKYKMFDRVPGDVSNRVKVEVE